MEWIICIYIYVLYVHILTWHNPKSVHNTGTIHILITVTSKENKDEENIKVFIPSKWAHSANSSIVIILNINYFLSINLGSRLVLLSSFHCIRPKAETFQTIFFLSPSKCFLLTTATLIKLYINNKCIPYEPCLWKYFKNFFDEK